MRRTIRRPRTAAPIRPRLMDWRFHGSKSRRALSMELGEAINCESGIATNTGVGERKNQERGFEKAPFLKDTFPLVYEEADANHWAVLHVDHAYFDPLCGSFAKP